jgi:hypothetical protein
LRKDIKALIDDYINLVVKATMEVAGNILIKIITEKFFHFIEVNRIEFKNEKERIELEKYFIKQYKKKLGGK